MSETLKVGFTIVVTMAITVGITMGFDYNAKPKQPTEQVIQAQRARALKTLSDLGTVISIGKSLNYNINRTGLSPLELQLLATLSEEYKVVYINKD